MDFSKEALSKELGMLVEASLRRHEALFGAGTEAGLGGQFSAENLNLADYPITALIEQLYDYVVHAVWNTDKSHLHDAITDAMEFRESCREFVASATSIREAPTLLRLIDTAEARWKVDEADAPLTIKEIALLAQMDERSVRNATSKSNGADRLRTTKFGGEVCADSEHISTWLAGRRAWKPTRFISASEPKKVTQFHDKESFTEFVSARMTALDLEIHDVVDRMNLAPADVPRIRQVLEGQVPCPLGDALALARALEFDEAKFTGLLLEAFYQPQLHHIRSYLEQSESKGKFTTTG